MLGSICSFIELWTPFFSFKEVSVKGIAKFPDEDFWTMFVEKAIGQRLRETLREQLVASCKERNPYVLFSLVNIAQEIASSCLAARNFKNGPLHKMFPHLVSKYESPDTQNKRSQFLSTIFEAIKDQALAELQQFLQEELAVMEEQKQNKIRYAGVFANVRKALFVVEYFIANCNQICDGKIGGYTIINRDLVMKTYTWLFAVSRKEPKYTNLVLMENTYWMLEEMNRI